MQSYRCLLCKKSNRPLLTIQYRNGQTTIRDDISEICGFEYVEDLQDQDVICKNCVKVIDNMVKLKNQICEIISEHVTYRNVLYRPCYKYLNLSKVWDIRLTPTQSSNYEESSENASPNNLLIATSSVAYRDRQSSEYLYDYDSPDMDAEAPRSNSRRKRRGHNWSKRKGGRKSSRSRSRSRSRSTSKVNRSAASSRLSRVTTASKRQQTQKQAEELHLKHIVGDFLSQNNSLSQFARVYLKKFNDYDCDLDYYGDDNISTNNIVTKTRFAKELRKKLLEEYQKLVHVCAVCSKTHYSLEELTEHRVQDHNETARYTCNQCNFDYLTQEHLDRHTQTHYENFLAYCIYCFEEYKDKKLYDEHLNEHLTHSFPCIYCDKYFLNKQRCDAHIREQHPGRKKKIKKIKPQSILDRIDKDPDKLEKENSVEQEGFVVKILLQSTNDGSTHSYNDREDDSVEIMDDDSDDMMDYDEEDDDNEEEDDDYDDHDNNRDHQEEEDANKEEEEREKENEAEGVNEVERNNEKQQAEKEKEDEKEKKEEHKEQFVEKKSELKAQHPEPEDQGGGKIIENGKEIINMDSPPEEDQITEHVVISDDEEGGIINSSVDNLKTSILDDLSTSSDERVLETVTDTSVTFEEKDSKKNNETERLL